MNADVTGPDDATRGIISVTDIFGFAPQTLQGADILAYGGSGSSGGIGGSGNGGGDDNNWQTIHNPEPKSNNNYHYKVFMPDFFAGNPADPSTYPPDTPAKHAALTAWFAAHPRDPAAAALEPLVHGLSRAHPRLRSWGLIGYCFGGAVAEMVAADMEPFREFANPFAIVVAAHPGRVAAPASADAISVPYMLLDAGDDAELDWQGIAEFKRRLRVPHHVEVFEGMWHGWLAARAELEDQKGREGYEKGYAMILEFLKREWPAEEGGKGDKPGGA